MTPYFDSWSAFVAMDGHGPFVWAAYAIALVVMGFLIVAPLRRRRRFMLEQQGRLRRQQAQKTASAEAGR